MGLSTPGGVSLRRIVRTPWPDGLPVPEGSSTCGMETEEIPWDEHWKRVKKHFRPIGRLGRRLQPYMLRSNCLFIAERDGKRVYSLVSEIVW